MLLNHARWHCHTSSALIQNAPQSRNIRSRIIPCSHAAQQEAQLLSLEDTPSTWNTAWSSKREFMLALAAGIAGNALLAKSAKADSAVGSYLPPAGIDDLVVFKPGPQKTPALRAGTIKPSNPYSFDLPPTWKEARISNTQNGNFCQPNCGEPWTEVVFEDSKEGKLLLIASPLVKLTNKPEAKIEELGTPDALLPRIGPYITGTYLDEDDVISSSQKVLDDGRTYYFYEIYATYGLNGPHTLTAATTKGEVLYLFILCANDKQWPKSESKLRKVVETFRA